MAGKCQFQHGQALVGCDAAAAGCADAFVTRFGRRVMRRPLSQSELDRYLALWQLARERTGLTLRELGQALGGKDYAAVSVGLKRFEKRLGQRKPLTQIYRRSQNLLHV